MRNIFFFELCPFEFHLLSGGGRDGMLASVYSQRRRFWHACQRITRVSEQDKVIFCATAV